MVAISSRSIRGDRGPRQGTGAGGRCRPASARRRARCRQVQPLPSQERLRRVRLGTSRSPGTSGVSNTSRVYSTSWVFGGSRTCGSPRAGFRSAGPSAPDSPGVAPDLEPGPDHRTASGDRFHPAGPIDHASTDRGEHGKRWAGRARGGGGAVCGRGPVRAGRRGRRGPACRRADSGRHRLVAAGPPGRRGAGRGDQPATGIRPGPARDGRRGVARGAGGAMDACRAGAAGGLVPARRSGRARRRGPHGRPDRRGPVTARRGRGRRAGRGDRGHHRAPGPGGGPRSWWRGWPWRPR